MANADAFLERCLLLDLETRGRDEITALGAALGSRSLLRRGRFSLVEAFGELDELAREADFVLGHNLLGHDLPILAARAPQLGVLERPVVDTLYLSPLAFPENPYHHLVKDYKLVRRALNDPLADARLAARVFADQWQSFSELDPELLAFYAGCFEEDGLKKVFQAVAGGPPLDEDEAKTFFLHRFQDVACRAAIGERDSVLGPAWAFTAAWLSVAGGSSVLPPWVRHRYPEVVRLLVSLRDVPCVDGGCAWCRSTHDPEGQLRRFFGFEEFRPEPATATGGSLQGAIVRHGIADQSLLAILATGAGKSIAFQLPALVRYFRRGLLTVVISPLQALMKDQVDNLNAATGTGCAAALYGLLTPPERGAVLERVRLGDVALLYVAPEQLRNASFRRVVEQREIGAWIFDEAHCLSKWGHDFRPDYLYASRFIRELADRQSVPVPAVGGFTATAKTDVKEEIVRHFRDEIGQELTVFESGVGRDELVFRVESVKPAEKLARIHELLEGLMAENPEGCAVIYFSTRRRTEEAADFLRKKEIRTGFFHAGMKAPEKRDVLEAFVHGELPVVCATNAFGMGIDKDDVRLVVHADVPGSLENYLQEAGRAGRDRRTSHCVLLFDDADLENQFKLAAISRLSQRDIAEILRGLRRAGRRHDADEVVLTTADLLRDDELFASFDHEDRYADTKVKTAVAWLERSGYVERTENRTRVFQGRLRLKSLDEAGKKLASLDLPRREQERWFAILSALLNAEPDEGLSADEIAELPDVRWDDLHPRDRETPGQKVLRILHDMAEKGFLTTGLRLTVFVTRGGPRGSKKVLEAVCDLERAFLDLLQETEPDADSGDWFHLSLRPLNQRLVDDGHPSNPTTLLRLLHSLAQDGKGLAAKRGSLELIFISQGRFRVRLRRPWDALRKIAELRWDLARELLNTLLERVPEGATGRIRVEIGSEELVDALRRNLTFQDLTNRLAAAERGLLFLHEQKAVHLQHGLAVFRQAMTIRVRAGAKGRRYSKGDYQPLSQHYGERTFQVHAMAHYARLGMEAIRSALAFVRDYFRLGKTSFVERHFADEQEILERATSRESFHRIVDSLRNPEQIRLVASPVDRNLLVLAGPGSGKTRVVVHRCAYLLRVERVPARSLLVVCFNRNAALEVRRRLRDLVGDDARGVTVRTWHGLAMRLTGASFLTLQRNDDGRQEPDFKKLITDAIRLLNDPDGLLGLEADELRDRLLAGYSHILVDEYQDINEDQYDLLSAVAGRTEADADRKLTILAVGDDDQNIYAFTGANVEFIRRFRDDYDAEVHYLVESYRSTAHILAAADQLVRVNRDRMKTEHPVRVDDARRRAPEGGRWSAIEPAAGGRVERLRVADAGAQAATLVRRLRSMKELDPELDWNDCAVLARRHEDLAVIRAVLEEEEIPLSWTADRQRLPSLTRIREIAAFLAELREIRHELRTASQLALAHRPGDGGTGPTSPPDTSNPWRRLVEELVEEWRVESHDAELSVGAAIEFFYEALAERKREPSFGAGVRLLTVHAAKGLEFRHVFLPDGGWSRGDEEERRLYYVGMTRARETLHLFVRGDEHNEFAPRLHGPFLHEPDVAPASVAAEVLARRYEILGPQDLYLSWAGHFEPADPVHRRLSSLAPGDLLTLTARNEKLRLSDASGGQVAQLSKQACGHWSGRLDVIEAIRVLAIVRRDRDDADPQYRQQLKTETWEVPLVEVIRRRP